MGGCPVCSKRLDSERRRNYSFRRCTGCFSIWLTNDVLELMLRDMVAPREWTRWPDVDTFDVADPRSCPDCHQPMRRAMFLDVAVDVCIDRGHGFLLDYGELRQVLHAMATQGPPEPEPRTSLERMADALGIAFDD